MFFFDFFGSFCFFGSLMFILWPSRVILQDRRQREQDTMLKWWVTEFTRTELEAKWTWFILVGQLIHVDPLFVVLDALQSFCKLFSKLSHIFVDFWFQPNFCGPHHGAIQDAWRKPAAAGPKKGRCWGVCSDLSWGSPFLAIRLGEAQRACSTFNRQV